jgi:hypothetical protein
MRPPTPDQWRYQGLAESLAQIIRKDPFLISDPGALEDRLLYVLNKVYEMGKLDPEAVNKHVITGVEIGRQIAESAISVTDLSHIPEIRERINKRKDELC